MFYSSIQKVKKAIFCKYWLLLQRVFDFICYARGNISAELLWQVWWHIQGDQQWVASKEMSCSSSLPLPFLSHCFLVLTWHFSHPWFSEWKRQKSDTRISGCLACWWRLGWSDVLQTSVQESSWTHRTGFVQLDPYRVTGQVVLGRQEFGCL